MTAEERPIRGAGLPEKLAPSVKPGGSPTGMPVFGRSSVLSAARERYDDDWYEEYIKGAVDMNGPMQLPLAGI